MKKKQSPRRYLFLRFVFALIVVLGISLCAFGSFLSQKINNWLVYSPLIGEELAVVQNGQLYLLSFGLIRASYSISPLAPSLTGNVRFPEWSPDGEWVAFDYYEGEGWGWRESERSIYIVKADGTNLQRLTIGVSPQWDSSGRTIYYTDWNEDETLKAIDLDTGITRDVLHSRDCGAGGSISNFRISPISNHALLQIYNDTYEWNSDTETCSSIAHGWDAAWSANEEIAAGVYSSGYFSFQAQPHLVESDGGRSVYIVHGGSPAWSLDGRYFVYDSPHDSNLIDWSLYMYDTVTEDVYDLGMNFSHPSWRP